MSYVSVSCHDEKGLKSHDRYDRAAGIDLDSNGCLTVYGPSGLTVAVYAPGAWSRAEVVENEG